MVNLLILLIVSFPLIGLGQVSKTNKTPENAKVNFRVTNNKPIMYHNPLIPLAEPHLAVNPVNPDHMVAVAIAFDSARYSATRTHIVVFATRDNGKTWKTTDLPMTTGYDPWVAVSNNNDVMVVALAGFNYSNKTALVYFSSQDGGFTWSEPKSLGGGHDHPTMITNPRNNRLYLLSSQMKRKGPGELLHAAYLNYSDDWKNFQDSAHFYGTGTRNSNTLTLSVHPDGTLILPFVEYTVREDKPEEPSFGYIFLAEGNPVSGKIIITEKAGLRKGFPVFAIDTSGRYKGRMYLVKNTGREPDRSEGLFLHYADDILGPWSKEVRIDHNEQKEKFMRTAALAINKEGIPGLAWVDRRMDKGLKKNDIYFTISRDGAKSFEKEIRITEVGSDPTTEGNGKAGERFISGGDYMGFAAKADGSFQLLWSDSRSGVFQLYTCNVFVSEGRN